MWWPSGYGQICPWYGGQWVKSACNCVFCVVGKGLIILLVVLGMVVKWLKMPLDIQYAGFLFVL